MRLHIFTGLTLLLLAAKSHAQLRLPDLGTQFLDDTAEPAQVSEGQKKKHSENDGKTAEAIAKAADLSGTTIETTGQVVQIAGERLGEAETAAQFGTFTEKTGGALSIVATGAKLVRAEKKGELATEVANQGAEKVVGAVGGLVGGTPGKIVIGASYSATKAFLEDTAVGQRIDRARDETYLKAAGAYDAKPRTGEYGPEAYETKKLGSSMKKVGMLSPTDNVAGLNGFNTGRDQHSAAATIASATSKTDSGLTFDIAASVRKAGIDTNARIPQKIVVNTTAVTKLVGVGSPVKSAMQDPTALKTMLDSHVDAWKIKDDQRKAAEAAEAAYEEKEREDDLAEKARVAAAAQAERDQENADRESAQRVADEVARINRQAESDAILNSGSSSSSSPARADDCTPTPDRGCRAW